MFLISRILVLILFLSLSQAMAHAFNIEPGIPIGFEGGNHDFIEKGISRASGPKLTATAVFSDGREEALTITGKRALKRGRVKWNYRLPQVENTQMINVVIGGGTLATAEEDNPAFPVIVLKNTVGNEVPSQEGMVGPPGRAGDQGDKGEQGDPGPAGDQGDAGDSGQTGARGDVGTLDRITLGPVNFPIGIVFEIVESVFALPKEADGKTIVALNVEVDDDESSGEDYPISKIQSCNQRNAGMHLIMNFPHADYYPIRVIGNNEARDSFDDDSSSSGIEDLESSFALRNGEEEAVFDSNIDSIKFCCNGTYWVEVARIGGDDFRIPRDE